MFGLEENFTSEAVFVDKREPYEKIYVEANGGIDIEGEWQFAGSYSVHVYPKMIGNFYAYEGRIYKGYKRKGRWRVYLSVCGGESNRIRLSVLSKTAPSIRQARKIIVQAISDFESTSRFKDEMAPQIYDEDNRTSIIKEINGELFWIASTWDGAYSAIQGKMSYSNIQCPLGYGSFYYRKRKWNYEYPRKEDGTKDYDAEPDKVYLEPTYGHLSVTSWSSSGGGAKANEIKEKINQAIFNLNDPQTLKREHIRYFSLKGRI